MPVDIEKKSEENIENRVARVFVSSTFVDMQNERVHLVRYVFPRIKAFCKSRGVEFIPIDLRWGIDPERRETLRRCLEEIDHSRPFFICLLGRRYGSTLSTLNDEITTSFKKDYPAVVQYVKDNISITEAEICYGVLGLPKKLQKKIDAHFWFRPTQFHEKRLQELIKRIHKQKRFPISEYKSIDDLSTQVEETLKKWIEKTWPSEKPLTWLEKQNLEQSAFERSRRRLYVPNDRVYDDLKRIVENTDLKFLTVYGKSGLGKSSLLINWTKRYREENKKSKVIVLTHYISASEGSDQPATILRRFKEMLDLPARRECFLRRIVSTNAPMTDEDLSNKTLDDLIRELDVAVVRRLANNPKQEIIFVIDGLNQLSEQEGFKELFWLPTLRERLKIIVSTIDTDTTYSAIQSRKSDSYDFYEAKVLTDEQKIAIIDEILHDRGRDLNNNQKSLIARAELTSNPLALCVLLDELCTLGNPDELDNKISNYLQSRLTSRHQSDLFSLLKELLSKVLERIENHLSYFDCGDMYCGFVQTLAPLVAVSRYGLTDEELCGITDYTPLVVSTFLSVFDTHLVDHSGRYSFSHDIIKSVVEERYKSAINKTRERLVVFFDNYEVLQDFYQDVKNENEVYEVVSSHAFQRRCQEVPWQLKELGQWERLYKFLLNLNVFNELYDGTPNNDFCQYWNDLLTHGFGFNEYLKLDVPEKEKGRFYERLGCLTFAFKAFDISEQAFQESLGAYQKDNQSEDVARTLREFARLYYEREKYDLSKGKYSECCKAYRELIEKHGSTSQYRLDFSWALGGMADLYKRTNDFEQSRVLYEEGISYAKSATGVDFEIVAAKLFNGLANLYKRIGRYDDAESQFEKSLNLYSSLSTNVTKVYEHDEASTLNGFANVLVFQGKYSKAMEKYREGLDHYRRLAKINPNVYIDKVAKMLGNMGVLHTLMGVYDESFYHEANQELQESIEKYKEVASHNADSYNGNLALAYKRRGDLCLAKGDPKAAVTDFEEALKLPFCTVADDKKNDRFFETIVRAESFCGAATAYARLNELECAEERFLKSLELFQIIPEKNESYWKGLASVHVGLAIVYREQQKTKESLREWQSSCEAFEKQLNRAHAESVRVEYADSVFEAARFCLEFDKEKAREFCNKAVAIFQELAGKDRCEFFFEKAFEIFENKASECKALLKKLSD